LHFVARHAICATQAELKPKSKRWAPGKESSELTGCENVLGCSNGEKSRPPRFDDIGIESNDGVAGRDLNMHQLDAHGNTSKIERK
jgi:hypothetical protein